MSKDIILTVDYHDENCVIRRRDEGTGQEEVRTVATTAQELSRVAEAALRMTRRRRAEVVWIQESTTGWARVQALLGERVKFLLANVVQMPLPPRPCAGRRITWIRRGCSASTATASCRWRTSRRCGGDKCGASSACVRTW